MVRPSDFLDAVCAVCVHQMSDPELEEDHLEGSRSVSEAVTSPGTVPVMGESFCACYLQEEPVFGVSKECLCGEEDQGE